MPPTPATPGVNDKAITEIERLGFKWTLVPQFDLDRLSPDRRVQVRESDHYAPHAMVERYAVQMDKNEFPPIVVTANDWIVDGNTRIGASLRRKQTHFPAYVLNARYDPEDPATEKTRAELDALAATLNQQNGQSLTHKEARVLIRKLIAMDWLADQIGRAVGVTKQTVAAVKKEMAAEERLAKLGLRNGAIAGPSLRALGSETVLALNDEPYRQLTTLAVEAGLNTSEILDAAKDARATGSDVAALTKIADLRRESDERIKEHELTGGGKPPPSRMLRARLGYIAKYEDNPRIFVETNPSEAARHITEIERTLAVLEAVVRLQKAGIP